MVGRLSSDGSHVESNLVGCGLALLFFTAMLTFWTYSWYFSDRPSSLAAFVYASLFGAAGFLTLVVWALTNR